MLGIEKRLDRLNKDLEYLGIKIKSILTNLSTSYSENDSIRKLIRLIPTKKIYPQRLSNNLYGHTSVGLFVNDALITGGARDKNNVLNDNFVLNIDKNIKTSKLSLDLGRQKHTAVKIDDNNVLFTGGLNSGLAGNRITKNQVFNITSNTFTSKTDLPSSRERHSACLINNNVFFLGGVTETDWGNINPFHVMYNINTNNYTNKSNFGNYAGQATIVFEDNYILFGGQINQYSQVENYCKLYNTSSNSFTNKTNLNEKRSTLTAMDLKNNTVLLSGGYVLNNIKSNKNEIYNISSNNYTTKTNLNPSRSDHAAVYLGSGGAILGGKGTLSSEDVAGNPLNLVEFYNYYDDAFYKAGDS